ncbi:hypothetical protein BJ741DRAFT_604334 [Chytriomyces cf. hyalinus JEL632]|nr:hypothetical protein BJ741DRAFT_604334 [Chytriomyces cf. hyalinus JEL632]
MADVVSKGADGFVLTYYKLYDTQRHMLHKLYKEDAAILWNGNAFAGISSFKDSYLQLPPSVHEYQTYDAQQVGDSSILVVVTGAVKLGDKPQPRPFSQTFVLNPTIDADGKKVYLVGSDTFRFT